MCGSLPAASLFVQTNLTSNVPGLAANLDPHLVNPWGVSFGSTTPFWASDQGMNVSTLYNGAGVPQALVVTTPPAPTGQVFNSATNSASFVLPNGSRALFLFDSLSGQLAGFSGGTTTQTVFTATDGAAFTGLAIGNNGTSDFLYASDFANGKIDVFNSTFGLTTLPGNFTDPNLPAGYSPYNIQTINGMLYVEYDTKNPSTGRPTNTPNTGIVDIFNLNGVFQQRLVTNTDLNSPWGITQAPASFGTFGGDILVGNFGDGRIAAFDSLGTFVGFLSDTAGNPIVNSGLWSLEFRAPGSGFDSNALFFTAGINNEADGLFGELTVAPEPGTMKLLAAGFGLAVVWLALRSAALRRA